jgi:hypothetical protein
MAHHPSCQSSDDRYLYMPTRVLDVGVSDENIQDISNAPVKLVFSSDITDNRTYACLSHRWGPPGQTIVTKKATQENHRVGMEYRDLDVAYQDTVYTMRQLGVRYLCIDSLCIIQDDPEDWRAESASMAMIYNRGLFTLAMHCNSSRSLRRIEDPKRIVSDPSVSPPVYSRLSTTHVWEGHYRDHTFPLFTRAWVFQERLLSPRVIHFSKQEIS